MQFLLAPKFAGGKLSNLFFSFAGRLGRLGFLLRGMALGITTGVLLAVGFTLFLYGALWWLGLPIAVIAFAALVVGYASLVVRRLHDMNFSGYHAIWVVSVQLVCMLVLPVLIGADVDISGISAIDPAFNLVTVAIGTWLLLSSGTKEENRFGYRPNRKGWRLSRAFKE
jgi:uncharacterized membrane protein YhaH (DUF805 family)